MIVPLHAVVLPMSVTPALVHESCGLRGPDRGFTRSSPGNDQIEGMQSRVHPAYKTKYRVANWASYDRALVRRGDVTVWMSPKAIATWKPAAVGTRSGQRKYSDLAIETALTLRLVLHLPFRQTEGFLTSLFGLMGLDLPAPDHTTLSRRGQLLEALVHESPRPEESRDGPSRDLLGGTEPTTTLRE